MSINQPPPLLVEYATTLCTLPATNSSDTNVKRSESSIHHDWGDTAASPSTKTSLSLTSSTNGADVDVPMWWCWTASAVMAAVVKSRTSTWEPMWRYVEESNFVDWFQRGKSLKLASLWRFRPNAPLHFSSSCPKPALNCCLFSLYDFIPLIAISPRLKTKHPGSWWDVVRTGLRSFVLQYDMHLALLLRKNRPRHIFCSTVDVQWWRWTASSAMAVFVDHMGMIYSLEWISLENYSFEEINFGWEWITTVECIRQLSSTFVGILVIGLWSA